MRKVDNGVTQLILLPAAANNAVHAKHTHQIARLTLSPTNATHSQHILHVSRCAVRHVSTTVKKSLSSDAHT
jgi:hypothetical protein